MLKDKTLNRDREIFRLSKKLTIGELADQFSLSEDYVSRILAHHARWGQFA